MSHQRDRQLCVHGHLVVLRCEIENLWPALDDALGEFRVADFPDGFAPLEGTIAAYEHDSVLRHLSPTAKLLPDPDGLLEIYHEDDRYWIVDDRWGLTEMNLRRGTWRSWVLPHPDLDPARCVEAVALQPLAHLLRPRGLHLLPAVSVAFDDWGVLLLASCDIEPELSGLARAGYDVVGQRWTALREDDGRLSMLRMPGLAERRPAPRPAVAVPLDRASHALSPRAAGPKWVDLTNGLTPRNHAFCQTVMVVEPGRRTLADITPLPTALGQAALRRVWPMADLSPVRRVAQWTNKVALGTTVCEARLARDPARFARLLDLHRTGYARPQVTIHVGYRAARHAAAV